MTTSGIQLVWKDDTHDPVHLPKPLKTNEG